jgi:hypothetical protein
LRLIIQLTLALSTASAAALLVLTAPAHAQLLPANQARIVKAFQASPSGGKPLVTEVTALALENPANVVPICLAAKEGPLPHQYAAAAGLRRAYDTANSNGNAELAATIQTEVVRCGDASATAFASGEAADDASTGGTRVTITGTTTAPVSPAKP